MPLAAALRANNHLHTLLLRKCCFTSALMVSDALLPCIMACASLRRLDADCDASRFDSDFGDDEGPDDRDIFGLIEAAEREVKARSGVCGCPRRSWMSADGTFFRSWYGCWDGNGPCRNSRGGAA